MPEGKKDDRLDHEELEDGAVRAEQLSGGKVEEEEGIEGQADGDVVDDGHVEVAAGDAAGTGDILGLEQTLLSDKGPPSPLALPACPSARLSEGSLSHAPRATDRSGQNTGGRAPVSPATCSSSAHAPGRGLQAASGAGPQPDGPRDRTWLGSFHLSHVPFPLSLFAHRPPGTVVQGYRGCVCKLRA